MQEKRIDMSDKIKLEDVQRNIDRLREIIQSTDITFGILIESQYRLAQQERYADELRERIAQSENENIECGDY